MLNAKFLNARQHGIYANDACHQYYDLLTTNADTTGLNDISCQFNESRDMPYIKNPNEYFLSVVRFEVETGLKGVPKFIPTIQTGQSDINKTIYEIAIIINGIVHKKTISWLPEDQTINSTTIAPPILKQDMTTSYYYCYSYHWFLGLINDTITEIFADATAPLPHPYMLLDSNMDVHLYLPVGSNEEPNDASLGFGWNGMTTLNGGDNFILFNPALMALFSTFDYLIYGQYPISGTNITSVTFDPTMNGWGILCCNLFTNNVVSRSNYFLGTTLESIYIDLCTRNSPLYAWNPISSIVFKVNLLPITPTNVGQPKIYNSNNQSGLLSSSGTANFASYMTDIVVPFGGENTQYTPTLLYIPQGEYRLVDMNSTEPLSQIQVQVLWKDRYNNENIVKLGVGASANMKIMFRKKIFNNI